MESVLQRIHNWMAPALTSAVAFGDCNADTREMPDDVVRRVVEDHLSYNEAIRLSQASKELQAHITTRLQDVLMMKLKLTRTDADIGEAVQAWCENPRGAEDKYGHISKWLTNKVTTMRNLFHGQKKFNEDISHWNVFAVTDMFGMFCDATEFNQPLKAWGDKVSKVTDMKYMFCRASSFNQDLSNWNVASDTETEGMFEDTDNLIEKPACFNQDLSGWDVGNVEDMELMLWNTARQNKPSWYTKDRSQEEW